MSTSSQIEKGKEHERRPSSKALAVFSEHTWQSQLELATSDFFLSTIESDDNISQNSTIGSVSSQEHVTKITNLLMADIVSSHTENHEPMVDEPSDEQEAFFSAFDQST